jgi:XTP/dITP diphosphohydrolase
MSRKLTGPLVIATHNPGKLAEMRELLAPYGIEAQSAGELGLAEPDETGTTFAANARIKAVAAMKATGKVAFADDSGLVVDALGGDPGIYSARWAGPDKDFRFAMNQIQTLLIEKGAKLPEQRRSHFVAALCLAWPDGHTEEFEGRVDGVAVWPPRGDAGFGYDPLFLPDGFDRTFGEMSCRTAPAPSSCSPTPACARNFHYNFKYLSAADLNWRWPLSGHAPMMLTCL